MIYSLDLTNKLYLFSFKEILQWIYVLPSFKEL